MSKEAKLSDSAAIATIGNNIDTKPCDEPTISPAAIDHEHLSITATPTIQPGDDVPNASEQDKAAYVPMDIEHVAVKDDPREWSNARKNFNLFVISVAAIAPTLGVHIYNRKPPFASFIIHTKSQQFLLFWVYVFPAFNQIKAQLHASDQEIALSLSIFIFIQGTSPLLWCSVSEIMGRKVVYITALIMYSIGCIVAALARTMPVLIGMRSLQAVGASVAFTLASASIADMYDTHERGTRVGIYYAVPLLGPSVGPMLGGVLIQVWNWRATFWFMVIFGGLSIILCFFIKESFRKERSLVYQAAKTRASSRGQSRGHSTLVSRVPSRTNVKASMFADTHVPQGDVEKGIAVRPHQQTEEGDVKVTLADVNPISPAWQVLKQRSNVAILFASGSMFGFNYGICYTCARTFAAPPYSYDALEVGAILLSFGLGNVGGSLLGGRWSDRILVRLKAANGGVGKPEMRLQSTTIAMLVLPFAVVAYGWTAHFHVNVAAPAVALFIAGFALFWGYSSTLAYIVDSNPGRASSAIAMNSCFRGLAGLVVAEVSAPIQDAIGDGGLYTIWAGILFAVAGLLAYVSRKGADWRQKEEQKRLEKELHALQRQRQQTEQAH